MSMTNKSFGSATKAACAVVLGASVSVSAIAQNIVFNNAVNDLVTRFNPGLLEVGDEVLLNGGSGQLLSKFTFEFYGLASGPSFSGAVQAQVRFYTMGPGSYNGYPSPGAVFYDSGLFSVPSPTSRSTFVFTVADFGALVLPSDDITWSVQFSGMGSGDEVGVDLYDPSVVGSNFPDYWENNGGWVLKTNNAVHMNFGATFETPEPSTVALLVLGGLGFMFVGRRGLKK